MSYLALITKGQTFWVQDGQIREYRSLATGELLAPPVPDHVTFEELIIDIVGGPESDLSVIYANTHERRT